MGCGYWDYNDTGTTTSTWGDTDSTSTATPSYLSIATPTMRVRRILVRIPDRWDKEKHAAFVKLVNRDTNTGWKVEMIITGDIAIVDPDIETREMDEFAILLKENADFSDKRKINAFFNMPDI